MSDGKVRQLPMLPLRELLVFPHTVTPLFVGREKSIRALDEAMAKNREIFLAAQKKPKTSDPQPEEIYEFGTIGQILQLLRLPDGTVKILVEGKKRGRITKYLETQDLLMVEVLEADEPNEKTLENEALIRTVKSAFDTYVKLNKKVPPEMVFSIASIEEESRLADTLVVQLTNLKLVDKQKILETVDPVQRLEEIFTIIQSEIEILRVEKKIRARVKRQMEKTQKEYYLNEQMNAIQKELGNSDDIRSEIAEIESKVKSKKLSDEARDKVRKELKKLRGMSPMSAEATVVRNYIDALLALPWGEYSVLEKDIVKSEEVLEADHFGLHKVKERILEYLAVQSLSDEIKGTILCLVGPPGVGKTSLARSIARATGRNYSRISLGGVRDEAEIRGHRRTYIGAMPGKIINTLKKVSTNNPLILLDEIDKMSSDYRGDPASAMLEVLDPEQNHSFNDHYLDLDYDLSKVMFFATANQVHTIPRPLLDRMEVIYLSGYTEMEKLSIAKNHLVPKCLKNNGLKEDSIAFDDLTLQELIRFYTREAGVRSLEREIGLLCRKIVREAMQNHQVLEDIHNMAVTSIEKYLGPRKYNIGEASFKDEIGVCQGLAYTEAGGDLLTTEVTVIPGKGNLKITGKLGDVMQESAQAAITYVRSRAVFLDLDPDFYSKVDIHVHFPEGAIPKDGPSAGITMATAMVSALTLRPTSRKVAMTGEITLRGKVLPIGGLKEKLFAAHRGGVKTVIIPHENKKDLEEIPKNILDDMEIILAEHMDTVLLHALLWQPQDSLENRLKSAHALIGVQSAENAGHGLRH